MFRRHRNRNGQVMMELLLMIPFVFFMLMVMIEGWNLFRVSQDLSLMTREAANRIYRDCRSLDGTQLQSCVNTAVSGAYQVAGVSLKDFSTHGTSIGSLYRYNTSFTTPSPAAVQLIAFQRLGLRNSRFSTVTVDPVTLQSQTDIAISEAYYEYQPVTPIIGILNLFTSFPTVLYESTLF